MSFYYSVMYSFDLSRPLVGPFKDEESCWAAMVKDANHEHEEDLRNDTVSIVEKDKDAGEIVIKTPRELDDVPDTTTWSMFDNMEMPKNIVKAEAQMYFDSGACFHIPCKANLETREVYDLECSSGPCDDDGFNYEELEIDGVIYPLQDIEELEEWNIDDALDCLNRVIENKTFWRSFCGNAPEELIGCYKWILLKDALLNAGSNAICDFIGCDSISVTDVDELKVMLEDAKAQMPEETLEAYYKKYVEEADL